MLTLIVTGHGSFASGITSSLDLIMGRPGNYEIIDFPTGSNVMELEEKFDEVLSKHQDSKIMILCDLFGGSPFNVAMKKAMSNDNIEVYYGLNLGMLMEITSRLKFAGEEVDFTDIVEVGQKSIGRLDLNLLDEEEDSEEEL